MQCTTRRITLAASILCIANQYSSVCAFTLPNSKLNHCMSRSSLWAKKEFFFATEEEESTEQTPEQESRKGIQLFSDETLQEANDALSSVGWSGVAPPSSSLNISEDQMGELTSDDPFVKVRYLIYLLKHFAILTYIESPIRSMYCRCFSIIRRKLMSRYKRRWVLDSMNY